MDNAKLLGAPLYADWVQNIIDVLESGDTAPWVKPWHTQGVMPCNAVTGRSYNGLNVLLLLFSQQRAGYPTARWVTANAALKLAKARGVRIDFRGQKTTQVRHFQPRWKRDAQAGTREFAGYRVISWRLLNVAQIKGLPDDVVSGPVVEALPEAERNAQAEAFYAKIGARIHHGGTAAFYSPIEDFIGMPEFGTFTDSASYYGTLGHEHVHWTGHDSRLKRPIRNPFGSPAYAREELIAEFGAAFLCGHLGIEGKLQHPEYIGHWLKALHGDRTIALEAASKAQRAARFLLEAGGLVEPYSHEGG